VKEFISAMERTSREEEEKIETLERELREITMADAPVAADGVVKEGSDVLYGASRKRARVLRAAKKGYWLIETDMMKLTVPESELVTTQALPPPKPQVSVSLSPQEGPRALFELDLRGMRFEEAIKAVERQLDSAALAGLKEFGIIHGMGEGILQKGIREYLKQSPMVAEFAFARPEEGGFGKTNVKLRG
jgi:DNA mismatch repair protein MutS2